MGALRPPPNADTLGGSERRECERLSAVTDERALADAALVALRVTNAADDCRWPAVADRVREARERLGLAERVVASRLGMSSSEYQDIELHNDEAFEVFSVANLAGLAGILGMPLERLLFGPQAPRRSARTFFEEIARRLSSLAEAKGLTIDELGDKVGWELGGVITDPESLGEFNVVGLYDVCTAVGVDWVSALPVVEPDRPTSA